MLLKTRGKLLLAVGLTISVLISWIVLIRYSVEEFEAIRNFIYLVLYIIFCTELFLQILHGRVVGAGLLFAAFSGFNVIGLGESVAFALLEGAIPGSFNNLPEGNTYDVLRYYSYITLLTIGYGDITPATPYAQNLVITFALIGHFYSVVVMGVIIAKYISQVESSKKQKKDNSSNGST